MPITFVYPPAGTAFGPGYGLGASSTIQPVPLDWNWVFYVWFESETFRLIEWIVASGGGDIQSKFGITTTSQRPTSSNRIQPPAGATVHLVAELVNTNTNQIMDTGSVSVTWDPLVGLYDFLPNRISVPSTITGGFTASDRTDLKSILSAVFRTWTT